MSQTLVYPQSRFTDAGYCVPIVTIVHCSSNERFLRFNTLFSQKKKVAKERDVFDFGQSVFLPAFDSYAVVL